MPIFERIPCALFAFALAVPALAEDRAPPPTAETAQEQETARPAPAISGPGEEGQPAKGNGKGMREGTDYEEEIEVVGHYLNQTGTTESASAGSYTSELIGDRPLLRPGEVEELVPGMIVTQHSGAGKANQYFLRGFNLDHGTDFSTSIAGVPVNLPTNAHGQGYMDLNYLIPELVTHADYVKGPYYAHKGDFSSAGGEDIYYATQLPQTLLLGTAGSYNYYRALAASSPDLGGGKLLFALEFMHEDGPWEVPENFRKFNGVLRWTHPLAGGTLSVLAQGYNGQWNATNQVAQRAITSGEVGYFGTLSPSDGGTSRRYILSAEWDGEAAGGRLRANVFAVNYWLDLFSDFTNFLSDPVNGDQMEQMEHRWFEGTSGTLSWGAAVAGMQLAWRVGWDARVDEINPIGLFHTVDTQRIQTWSLNDVLEVNGALWADVDARVTDWLHAMLGLRGTEYYFSAQSNNPLNSGTKTAGLVLPKATLVFGPWAKTELFANFGVGYHSNDARGVLATVDAKTGLPIAPVTPLPKSLGAEIGVRTEIVPQLQSSLDFWLLDLDSELVWDADNGTNTPSGSTRRLGVEWANSYQPVRWLLFDLNVAFSQATFTQSDSTTGELAGQPVPEAVRWTVAAGASIHQLGPWSASLFLRYFGPRIICTEGTCGGTGGPANSTPIWSTPSTILNGQVSYQLTRNVKLTLEGLNLLNTKVDDIAYYYQTRQSWESPAQFPQGVWDYEVHPTEPLELRGTVTVQF